MIKFAFVQYLWVEFLGTMYLSSVLKRGGHDSRVFIGRNKEIIKEIKRYNPDVVAFSIFTGQYGWAVNLAKEIKENLGREKFILVGGPHPTFYPDIIHDEFIDAICIGEGEGAIIEFADKFTDKRSIREVRNFWVKDRSEIIRNPLRPLIQDLDSLPLADREIYYSYGFLRENPNKHFIAGRGCPYSCSFCFNASLRKMYQDISGNYVRLRRPENVIREIDIVRAKYPLPTLRFIDDTFIHDKKWLLIFLNLYKRDIFIPFYCNLRADLVDEEIIVKLKEANCYRVSFGIESGNETIRNKILNKAVTDEQIKYAAKLLRKYDIKFDTANMLGLPGESHSDAWKTIQLNIDIKANSAWTSILQPYPGTEIASYALEKKLIKKINIQDICGDAHTSSPLDQPDIKRIENLHKFVYLILRFPLIKPVVKLLIRLPPNAIFNLIYKTSYLLFFYSQAKRQSLLRTLEEALKAAQY